MIDLFSPAPFVIMNQSFIPGDKILMLYFLLTFSRTKLIVALLWIFQAQ
jgi:hypothetical protein